MNIVLLGAQGSGKGTQGKILSDTTDMHYFDAGAHLRKLAKTDKKLDVVINELGSLLPDGIIFGIITEYLENNNLSDNIIFDGYPRSLKQYNLLTEFLDKRNTKINLVIDLVLSREDSVKRLSARRRDKTTNKIYNLITNPPGPEVDENNLVQREDDQPEQIERRLDSYQKTTQPLLDKIQNTDIYFGVDASKSIEEVSKIIENKISNLS